MVCVAHAGQLPGACGNRLTWVYKGTASLRVIQMYREREDSNPEGDAPYRCSAIAPLPEANDQEVDSELEHYILGSWNKGRGLKKNGLMKKVTLLPPPVWVVSS